ncbi:MAG TPA: hypothetical protein VLM89_05535 [Phycisphaerae bacterium]|nr:hypothetical protein [Phycisphaerae bacterium]
MSDEPSYNLDVDGLREAPDAAGSDDAGGSLAGRKWVGVQFECCGVYTRIYRNRDGTAYVGHCPRCQRQVRVAIGPGGTDSRMFRAS